MAHFAELDQTNSVTNVIVVDNAVINNLPFPESEPIGVAFCQSLYGANTIWKQTSYNANFRKNYAGMGYTYNSTLDAFVAPQPNPSCFLDDQTAQWICPPNDGNKYVWDTDLDNWVYVGPIEPEVVP